MDIGQTFTFEDSEFSIKRIIVPGGTDKDGVVFEQGRVDASRFVGTFPDRRLQRGRPKMFDYVTVANILGEPVEPTTVESDLTAEDEKSLDSWVGQRSDPEKIKRFIAKHYTEEELEAASSDDW